jgi:chromatin remodeling complex protein RSC6
LNFNASSRQLSGQLIIVFAQEGEGDIALDVGDADDQTGHNDLLKKSEEAKASKKKQRKKTKESFASSSADKAKEMGSSVLRLSLIFIFYLCYFAAVQTMEFSNNDERYQYSNLVVNGYS